MATFGRGFSENHLKQMRQFCTRLAAGAFGWLVTGIDNWAHVGGMAGGAAVSALLKPPTSTSDFALRVDHSLLAALGVVCFSGIGALNYYPMWQHVLVLEAEGNRLLAARQLEAAKLQFEHVKHIEPADSRPHLQLSSIYIGLGQERKAREECERALRLKPEIKFRPKFHGLRTVFS
jgi:tetratricopeptide (TPR) repeat protein